MERPQPSSQNFNKPKNTENKLPLSPKAPKIPKAPNPFPSRLLDSAGKYVRDSPNNFRKIAEHRRESPRNAEPVRRTSRDPYSSNRNPGETIDEHLAEIEHKAQKLLNSSCRSDDYSKGFYKSAPAEGFKVDDEEEISNEDEGLPKLEVPIFKPPKIMK